MAENLKTDRFANGDFIPSIIDSSEWIKLNRGAWFINDNINQFNEIYGKLYNWFAISDPRNVCPIGWHVPSYSEWDILTDFLGGHKVAGGKMKASESIHWKNPNKFATNESGFSGLPGGNRLGSAGIYGNWWSSTELVGYGEDAKSRNAWGIYLSFDECSAISHHFYKWSGFSVRCLKD
jgi:uncharacterized protein (TIGR02145 family)